MKKVLLSTIVLLGIGFTSCSKSSCECAVNGDTKVYTEEEFKDLGYEGDFEQECKDAQDCKVV